MYSIFVLIQGTGEPIRTQAKDDFPLHNNEYNSSQEGTKNNFYFLVIRDADPALVKARTNCAYNSNR